MKKLFERAKYVLKEEDGASNAEIIVWISVVLVIATALFFMRDSIIDFLGRATGEISRLRVN